MEGGAGYRPAARKSGDRAAALLCDLLNDVGIELHYLLTEPFVELFEAGLQRDQLVAGEDLGGFLHVTKTASVAWHDAHQYRRDAVGGEHVVAGHVLDVEDIVLRGHFADRNHLDALLLAVRRVDKQVAELPGPLLSFSA